MRVYGPSAQGASDGLVVMIGGDSMDPRNCRLARDGVFSSDQVFDFILYFILFYFIKFDLILFDCKRCTE